MRKRKFIEMKVSLMDLYTKLTVDHSKRTGKICNKIFSLKSISGENFFFDISATGYPSRKF